LLPALQNLAGDAVVVQQSPIRLILGNGPRGLSVAGRVAGDHEGSEVLYIQKAVPVHILVYMW
jgi:hypothetical protein